jgi:hypothetical protein
MPFRNVPPELLPSLQSRIIKGGYPEAQDRVKEDRFTRKKYKDFRLWTIAALPYAATCRKNRPVLIKSDHHVTFEIPLQKGFLVMQKVSLHGISSLHGIRRI